MQNKQLWITIKNKLQDALNFLYEKNPLTKTRIETFFAFIKHIFKSISAYVRRSWKSIAVVVPLFLVLYYMVGGYVTNTINKDINVEIKCGIQRQEVFLNGENVTDKIYLEYL